MVAIYAELEAPSDCWTGEICELVRFYCESVPDALVSVWGRTSMDAKCAAMSLQGVNGAMVTFVGNDNLSRKSSLRCDASWILEGAEGRVRARGITSNRRACGTSHPLLLVGRV